MAKKIRETREVNVNELLDLAQDNTDGVVTYANNVRFNISKAEVFLDFYLVSPNPTSSNQLPKANRLHRIILPVAVGAELVGLLEKAFTDPDLAKINDSASNAPLSTASEDTKDE